MFHLHVNKPKAATQTLVCLVDMAQAHRGSANMRHNLRVPPTPGAPNAALLLSWLSRPDRPCIQGPGRFKEAFPAKGGRLVTPYRRRAVQESTNLYIPVGFGLPLAKFQP